MEIMWFKAPSFEISGLLKGKYHNIILNDGWEKKDKNIIIRNPSIILIMSLKSFPIIFINMAGEMVYILEQRLTAQEINDQKATKGIFKITLESIKYLN